MFDLDRYSERIGFARVASGRTGDDDTLAEIHFAHATHVPFENLDIHLGRGISLDPARVFDKIVAQRRGGYCFEQNGLLLEVLRAIRYTARPLAARVVLGAPTASPRPRSHMLVLVERGRGKVPLIADVGFGTHNLLAPIPLEADVERDVLGERFRLRAPQEGAWQLEVDVAGTWTPLYRFTLEEQHPADFEMANWFTSTHPESFFVLTKIVSSVASPDRRGSLRTLLLDRQLKTGGETRAVESDADYRAVLRESFGIELPPGAQLRW